MARIKGQALGGGSRLKRFIKWALLLGLLGAFLGTLGLAGLFYYYAQELPDYTSIKGMEMVRVTRIYGANGELIGELLFEGPTGELERRTPVPMKEIPPKLVEAFLSAEDASFYEHGGIDYIGIARALVKGLTSGGFSQGASTITQQMVKNMILTPERTFKRKFQELILAKRIEEYLTKEEILELYLNQIYFGNKRYGIKEAARFYFNRDLGQLSVSQMALLASIPKAPSEINPQEAQKGKAQMDRVLSRRHYVLGQMLKRGKITQAEHDAADKEPVTFTKPNDTFVGAAPGFVEEVKRELIARYGEDQLKTLGARVETTLDPVAQQAAQKALRAALEKLDTDQGFRDPKLEKPKKPQQYLEDAAGILEEDGGKLRYGKTYPGLVVAVSDVAGGLVVDIGGELGWVQLKDNARYNPKAAVPSKFAPLGSAIPVALRAPIGGPSPKSINDLRKKDANAARLEGITLRDDTALTFELQLELGPQGALVAIDPKTFEVRAMVGGYEDVAGGLNRATSAQRQPGSTFKPVVYSTALDLKCADVTLNGQTSRRCYSPSTLLRDTVVISEDGKWVPKNADKKELGDVTMRRSLALSRNLSTVNLAHEITIERVVEYAKRLGYKSEIRPEYATALGASEVTPMEQAVAYAVFASGGYLQEPRFIRKITLPDGTETAPESARAQVIPADVAFLTTSLLTSVIQEGTGSKARELGRPAAGKTGTTNKAVDAWFVGYTPDLVAAIWLGFDDRRPLSKKKSVSGGGNVAPFWTQFMKAALGKSPASGFPEPPGVVHVQIDPKTGLRAYDGQPDAKDELFSLDAVPKEVAPRPDEATLEGYILTNSEATPTEERRDFSGDD